MKYPEQTDNYDVDIFNENFLELELGSTVLAQDLKDEVDRAMDAERQLTTDIQSEVNRAKAAEKRNADSISAEAERAQEKEQTIENNLSSETQSLRDLVDTAYASANGYTDTRIADLINGAPSTLDTLGEIAQAMQENKGVVEALDEAVGKKANASELDSHVKDRSNPHKVSASQAGAVSVEASQGLSETQKANARANIGAGTSSFSGNYNDLSNKPTIPSSLPANGGHAETADSATNATNDSSGRKIEDNYLRLYGTYFVAEGNGGNAYWHLLTINPVAGYITDQYVFDIARRSNEISTVTVALNSGADLHMVCDIKYSGDGIGGNIRAYEYLRGDRRVVEVYLIVGSWDDMALYPRLYHPRGTTITWDVRQVSALPTDATRNVMPERLMWHGNAETATNADTVDGHHFNWSGNSGQPDWVWGGNNSDSGKNCAVWNPSNFRVNYANSAGNADAVDGIHFSWSGQSGQPTWLWGSEDGVNSYVWRRSTLSVDYASGAGNADTVDGFHASGSHSAANTCVVRDGNGYTNLNYINSNTSNNENGPVSQVIITNGSDNYYRKASISHLKSQMGITYSDVSGRPTFSLSGNTLTINF